MSGTSQDPETSQREAGAPAATVISTSTPDDDEKQPTPLTAAESLSTPAPKPTTPARNGAFLRALGKTDAIIERLNRLIHTTSGLETTLSTINYSSEVLHYTLTSPPVLALLIRLRLYRQSRSKSGAAAASTGKAPLLALSGLISETRTTLRLFGLLPLWSWGAAVLRSPPVDAVQRTIAIAQVIACVLYQALENVAYLASKGVLSRKWIEGRSGSLNAWYLWSTRAWLGHVALDLVRLAYEARTWARSHAATGPTAGEGETQTIETVAARRALRAWRKSLVNNLAWAPLCVHWSLENGIGVPGYLVGLISLTAGAWGFKDAWDATAVA